MLWNRKPRHVMSRHKNNVRCSYAEITNEMSRYFKLKSHDIGNFGLENRYMKRQGIKITFIAVVQKRRVECRDIPSHQRRDMKNRGVENRDMKCQEIKITFVAVAQKRRVKC